MGAPRGPAPCPPVPVDPRPQRASRLACLRLPAARVDAVVRCFTGDRCAASPRADVAARFPVGPAEWLWRRLSYGPKPISPVLPNLATQEPA